MTILDPATIEQLFFARPAANSALVAALIAFGSSAASILVRDDLDPLNLPARPLLVCATGPIPGTPDWEMQRMQCAWWIYDDPMYKFSRIDSLLLPLERVYPADDPTVIPFCDVRRLSVSRPIYDAKLGGRPARSLPYQVSWR